MKLTKVNITKTIADATALLEKERQMSPALKAMFQLLLMLITLLAERLSLNSSNSSKPPSSDPNRKKKKKNTEGNSRKPGGQPGRNGSNLEPVDDPDEIIPIKLDKRTLPHGEEYHDVGFEARQVVEIEI
jgi:transposase